MNLLSSPLKRAQARLEDLVKQAKRKLVMASSKLDCGFSDADFALSRHVVSVESKAKADFQQLKTNTEKGMKQLVNKGIHLIRTYAEEQ
ncbi:hypothetical protein QFC24_001738 [Naganishia onofrii]|uniref:Uncharacterized protein n=1 Tax=Naganishia onofrii TaxID=1851511 RepID=A0ACC2XVH1_9TREE|nr:hypothetical protein QFC24_001738 [Naganishia onofrii]